MRPPDYTDEAKAELVQFLKDLARHIEEGEVIPYNHVGHVSYRMQMHDDGWMRAVTDNDQVRTFKFTYEDNTPDE